MTPIVFGILLFSAVPVALVLAVTAIWYIGESGNTVLFDSFAQQIRIGDRVAGRLHKLLLQVRFQKFRRSKGEHGKSGRGRVKGEELRFVEIDSRAVDQCIMMVKWRHVIAFAQGDMHKLPEVSGKLLHNRGHKSAGGEKAFADGRKAQDRGAEPIALGARVLLQKSVRRQLGQMAVDCCLVLA